MRTAPAPSVLTVTQDGDRLVAVRTATEPDDRARMRHEAGVLARFEHPGVVRLVDHAEGPPATLRHRWPRAGFYDSHVAAGTTPTGIPDIAVPRAVRPPARVAAS